MMMNIIFKTIINTANLRYLNTHQGRQRVDRVLESKVGVRKLKGVRWRKRSNS